MCKTGLIYLIGFTYGKFEQYVGQTINPLRTREIEHTHGPLLVDRKMRNHPNEYFIIAIEEGIPIEELDEKEQYYINSLNTFDCVGGLNLTTGGYTNKCFSEESLKKLSESHIEYFKTHEHHQKGKPLPDEWVQNLSIAQHKRYAANPVGTMRGKHHSEESKRKMSESKKGEKHNMYGTHKSAATIEKLSNSLKKHYAEYGHPMKGIPRSEETKKKISIANSGERNGMYGKRISEEAQARRIEKMKGHVCSAETRAKISAANKGRTCSDEKKRKLSEAQKGKPTKSGTKLHEDLVRRINAYLDWEWLMTQGINTQFPIELITQAVKDGR